MNPHQTGYRSPIVDRNVTNAVNDEVLLGYERIVLGYALDPNNTAHEALDGVEPQHFLLPANQVIFGEAGRHAGQPDVRMRTIEGLIGPQAPRALNALDRDLTVYVSDCIREAERLTARELAYYTSRLREAHKRRAGQAMLDRLADAFVNGDADRTYAAWAAFAEVIDGAPTVVGQSGVAPLYGDVATMLTAGIPEPPQPNILRREDGIALFYRGKVNVIFGDSEAGKTWVALAAIVEVLTDGGKGAFLDLDHNGMGEIITRLMQLGAKPTELGDPGRFRYCEPGDAAELDWFVADIASWGPDVAIADSMGEILPMLGLSSNSPDDYTTAHRRVLARLADSNIAVIAIDHLPKDDGAREKGQTGTLAKKRAVNGVTLRVSVKDQFTPGHGGSANLVVNKDRPGGLRGHCPPGKNAPAGRFVLTDRGNNVLSWRVTTPTAGADKSASSATSADVAELDALSPPPSSQRDVQKRLEWGAHRAMNALRTWRELRGVDSNPVAA